MYWIGPTSAIGLLMAGGLAALVAALVILAVTVFLRRGHGRAERFNPSRNVTPVDYSQEVLRTLSYAYHNPTDETAGQELTFALDAAVADEHSDPVELIEVVADFVDHRRRVRSLSRAVRQSALWPMLEEVLAGDFVALQLQALTIVARLASHNEGPTMTSRIRQLTRSEDQELSRAALTLEIKLDPISGLNLAFNQLETDGLWAIERIRSLLDAGGYRAWSQRFGRRRVTDVTSQLTNLARSGSPEFRVATVEVLRRIPDRAARVALGQLAYVGPRRADLPVTGP